MSDVEKAKKEITEHAEVMNCSFCGKKNTEAALLIQGPKVTICNECVHLCCDLCVEKGLFDPKKLFSNGTESLCVDLGKGTMFWRR